ncbi:MAG TPA: hypothetical protein PK490_19170 [Prosthecobacter sp.]|nr:hypothetical protein [Prosthecobacter sp.]HRK16410.1 hypothetical protein [Prosthecobacter sp.]
MPKHICSTPPVMDTLTMAADPGGRVLTASPCAPVTRARRPSNP